jgi:hypothetical protein
VGDPGPLVAVVSETSLDSPHYAKADWTAWTPTRVWYIAEEGEFGDQVIDWQWRNPPEEA